MQLFENKQKQKELEENISIIRQNVIEFFTQETNHVQGFFYGFESKKYSKSDIDPKLRLLSNYIDAATSLIECEQANS